jgi:acyl dehydratase
VNSVLTLAVTLGLGVPDTSENGFALGWDKIDLPNPLYEGDTLYSESEVLEVRPSRTHPEWGVVKLRTRGITKDGTVVIDFVRSIMVWKREHAPGRAHFPQAKS